MTVTVNGERWELPEQATLGQLLEQWGASAAGVAVAVDGAVVTRAAWPATTLSEGSAVEVLTAVQGG